MNKFFGLGWGQVRVDIMTVKELLGHKTLTMTLRYAHLAPAHKVKALEMLDLKLNNQGYCTLKEFENQDYGTNC